MLVVLSGVWFVSCQKDSSDSTVSPVDEFSDIDDVVSATAARYAVSTDSVTVGKCKGKLTEVAVADLSAIITNYISTTYTGSTVTYAAKDESGKVVVAVTLADGTLKGLLFNADGTFKEEVKGHLNKAKLTTVEISALPAAITTYISANYATAEIKKAGTNTDGEYFVAILIDSKVKVLLFSADSTFSKELEKPAMGGHGHKKH